MPAEAPEPAKENIYFVEPEPGQRIMDRIIEDYLVNMITRPESRDTKDTLVKQLRTLIDEIAGPAPSPLEKLLATNVGYCWFWLRLAEVHYLTLHETKTFTEGQARPILDRIDRAHRRLLSSVRLLATVRRLSAAPSPGVNVNILNALGGSALSGGAALASLADATPVNGLPQPIGHVRRPSE